MPRTLTRNARNYAPGSYPPAEDPPFRLDGFNSANTEQLVFEITTEEPWPRDPSLLVMTLFLGWNDDDPIVLGIYGGLWPEFKGGGLPHPSVIMQIQDNVNSDGTLSKRPVSGAHARIVVHAACRFAFSVRAE